MVAPTDTSLYSEAAMHTNKFLGAILLIAGTAIGAGMLALPVSTAAYGFWPSILLLFVCWFIATASALLMLEVNLWLKPESNIVSMAQATLGVAGQIVAWLAYLLLLYSLMAAYLSGMSDLITHTILQVFHIHMPGWIGCLILIFLVGGIIYLGIRPLDYLNRIFITGKILTYLALIFLITPHVQMTQLVQNSFHKIWFALPIVVTSFGYQTVIPGLRIYLNSDVKKLRRAIIIGSTAPLIVYLIWEFLILGTVPIHGESGLLSVLASGQPGSGLAAALDHIIASNLISSLFKYFVFFAIATSFIGVSFSLFGFLTDGFNIKQTTLGRLLAAVLTFIPPLIFTLFYPRGFIIALSYGGVFVAILLAILPALMAWSGRHWKKMASGYQVKGGIPLLVVILLFSLLVITAQVLSV